MPHRTYPRLLPLHVLAVVLLQATSFTLVTVLPVLVRRRFGAGDWETLLITAAPTVLFTLSIFWNDLFARTRFGRYMTIYWLVASLPLAFMAFATNYALVLIPHLVSSIGGAGYHPAAGTVLRRLYAPELQGRMYSIAWGCSLIAGAGMGYGAGEWLAHDEGAFRWILLLTCSMQLIGVATLSYLAHRCNADEGRVRAHVAGTLWQRVVEPVAHTKEVLAADPVFARYEAAYMTYGVGWMIAYALLPALLTDKLSLPYDDATRSTQVAYLAGMTLMIYPAGWLLDRLGAVRSTGLSFGLLSLYPIGLLVAADAKQLAVVSFIYGISHAGASVGWMLGPVSLAPTPDKVPQYVAIHATFVGIRGKVFQLLGVALYSLTHHSFLWPMVIASGAFMWSAVQMWQLRGRMKGAAGRS